MCGIKIKNGLIILLNYKVLAQAGLTYGKDVYDQERYERIRHFPLMMADISNKPVEQVEGLFMK